MGQFNKWKLLNSYRKNRDDIKSLLSRRYPPFIYKSVDCLPIEEIPIFTYHSVERKRFEYHMRYIAENNFKTILSSEFYDIISGKKEPIKNSIVLTFDDGPRSLWSIAFPLLKKYGLTAISFIVPSVVDDNDRCHPNLEDVWEGKSTYQEIDSRENSFPFCTWTEIEKMHKSGVIDFQSHTCHHHTIFKDKKIIDFVNPGLTTNFLFSGFNPVISMNGKDIIPKKLEWGFPIYKWGPTMAEHKRFIEDEDLCRECTRFVNESGGELFFNDSNWRKKLHKFYCRLEKEMGNLGIFQSEDERIKDLRNDLLKAKMMIENKLKKDVLHLCYPWGLGSDLSVKASKDVGFICNYWGHRNDRLVNKVGDDPYYISRILYEEYILSLPGKSRLSLAKQLKNKFNKYVLKKNL